MIDLHCHILPGIDDGPETLDEAVEMCRIAHADGIRTIVATPHFRPGRYDHSEVEVSSAREGLCSEVARLGIDITILGGADVTVTPELPLHLGQRRGLTINNTGRFFLAELPNGSVPARWDQYLLSLINKGCTPVLTHPERNGWFLSHRDALHPFVGGGGLVQITAMSLTGEAGEAVQSYSRYILKQGLAHIIATDAHSAVQRKPLLSGAVAAAADIIGRDPAFRMVTDIPQAIIEGRRPDVDMPEQVVVPRRSWIERLLKT
jgi:protein-tyrosine phosphatase